MGKLFTLHYLRGMAAIFVFLKHFGGVLNFSGNQYFNKLFSFGHYGVDIFFFISGFVIVNSLEKSRKYFFKNRFLRLFPVYWFHLILTIILLNINSSNSLSIKQILINFTMLQSFINCDNIDGLYWTLGIELKWYLIAYFLWSFKNPIRMLFFLNVGMFIFRIDRFNLPFEYTFNNLFIGNHINLFTLGVLSYKYFSSKNLEIKIYFVITLIFQFYFYFKHMHYFGFIIILIIVNLFFFLRNLEKSVPRMNYLEFLGNISYPLYLFHALISVLVIRLNIRNDFLQSVTIISLVLLVSYLVHLKIEKGIYLRWKY